MEWDYSPPDSGDDQDAYEFQAEELEEVEDEEVAEEDADPEEQFDRDLPAAHSYLPGGLVALRGRSVQEAGWQGVVPCLGHHSVVFPGESFPMLCHGVQETHLLQMAIQTDGLFGVLCPDFFGLHVPCLGVLCEVLEATEHVGPPAVGNPFVFKARARQRFRLVNPNVGRPHQHVRHKQFVQCRVEILPDILTTDPLRDVRSLSLGKLKNLTDASLKKVIKKRESALTPWPHFVYDMFDEQQIVPRIKNHFRELKFVNFPEDIVSLSFWVASNLSMSTKDRLTLFSLDNVHLRLYLELQHINKVCSLCCTTCMTEICKIEQIFAMSIEGLHSNYCNIGGHIHDIITVKTVTNVFLQNLPCIEFTWFPGYMWTIAVCSSCSSHVGWSFNAEKKSLRPQSFWGLCRKSLTPQKNSEDLYLEA